MATKCMYMIVTKDKYELPLYWANNLAVLSEQSGIPYLNLVSGFSKKRQQKNKKSKYVKIFYKEEDDEE